MAEYIDRKAVISAVSKAWAKDLEPKQYIEEIPAADVVDVVRCGKCRYAFKGPLDELLCRRKMLGMVRGEDFCSFGERGDNNVVD